MRRAHNLATFMCRLSLNLGGSTSWNPQGLPRLCFTFFTVIIITRTKGYVICFCVIIIIIIIITVNTNVYRQCCILYVLFEKHKTLFNLKFSRGRDFTGHNTLTSGLDLPGMANHLTPCELWDTSNMPALNTDN